MATDMDIFMDMMDGQETPFVEVVEKARLQVADLINADSREIVWTSGATESDNLAIKGVARFYKDMGGSRLTDEAPYVLTCLIAFSEKMAISHQVKVRIRTFTFS